MVVTVGNGHRWPANDATESAPQERRTTCSGCLKHEGAAQGDPPLRVVWGRRGSVRLPARKAVRVFTRTTGRGEVEGRGGKSLPSRPRAGSTTARGQACGKDERRQEPPPVPHQSETTRAMLIAMPASLRIARTIGASVPNSSSVSATSVGQATSMPSQSAESALCHSPPFTRYS